MYHFFQTGRLQMTNTIPAMHPRIANVFHFNWRCSTIEQRNRVLLDDV